MNTGLTVILTDEDRDRRGNFMLSKVVAAIAKAELPDDLLAIQKEHQRREDEIAQAIQKAPPEQRKEIARELTGRFLLETDEEKQAMADKKYHAYRQTTNNRLKEERRAWSAIHTAISAKQINLVSNGDEPPDGVSESELFKWGSTNGYKFQVTLPFFPDDTVNDYADSRAREILLNGAGLDWQYWTGRMSKLKAADAARLMSGLDPDKFPNLNEKPGRDNPTNAIENARKILRLAEAKGMSDATPAEWAKWAKENDLPMFHGFMLPLPGQRVVDGITKNVGDGTTASAEIKQATIITTHRLKTRTHVLDAVIELATKTAVAPNDSQSVYAEMVKLAELKDKPAPLHGYSSVGIQYRGKKYEESGEPDTFTAKNLRDRKARARAR